MTNRQAAHLRPGMTIRRKMPYADRAAASGCETFTVERVEHPARRYGEVTVHAGGQAFVPEEIERVRYLANEKMP